MGPRKIIRRINIWGRLALGAPVYLLIHIPKNGGTSLQRNKELKSKMIPVSKKLYKSRDYTNKLRSAMQKHGQGSCNFVHARLREVHPRFLKRRRPVAVLRNPWARVVSRFTFLQLAINKGAAPEDYTQHSFEAFLEERHEWGSEPYYWHRAIRGWYPQADYVVNEAGLIAADLLRLEHIAEEARLYFPLRAAPRRHNISGKTRQSYKDYYTPKTIDIVAEWYKADIERFGFDFDTPASRNTAFTPKNQNAYDPEFWKRGYNCKGQ